MRRDDFNRWIHAYERAWRTRGTADLADLFTETASYSTAPFERPYEGLAAISRLWEAERAGPDEVFAIDWELVAVEGDTGVARVEVSYGEPIEQVYRDLWVIELEPDGRCRSFEEWPFWPPGSVGSHAAGHSQP